MEKELFNGIQHFKNERDNYVRIIPQLNLHISHQLEEYRTATYGAETFKFFEYGMEDPIDHYWSLVNWGHMIPQLNVSNVEHLEMLNARTLTTRNGQIFENPYRLTTQTVQIICIARGIDYKEFEKYRNVFNQVINYFGHRSPEFKAIDWSTAKPKNRSI